MRAKNIALLLPLLAAIVIASGCVESTQCQNPGAEVFFCPQDNCAAHLTEKISSAGQSVHVAIYSLTEDGISQSLIAAHERGVEVRVLLDSLQAENKYSDDEALEAAGIPVKRMRKENGSMHNKFAVIDGYLVATGSFNYSANADRYNSENLLFISCASITQGYEDEFQRLWREAGTAT
ncbi:MAG: phospholipase D family protein [Candidatus Diapherotrites archaeon]|nr:phospholipase D family protein [Candidatus Diapherotrites archaeon]